VYDLTGRIVETLVDERQEPGVYQVRWDGRKGISLVPSGVYFYRLTTGGLDESIPYTATQKLILLR
ncbi:T9SS type A sorting domain-containing protein, partial [candidate division TA06 bacterium]|nr:T9SS type A sorting domain-containing protein [candidate division TA06 bacterium]